MRHSLFICKLTALILLLSVSSLRASCQESSYAKIYIEGKPYYVYIVRAGEGLYFHRSNFLGFGGRNLSNQIPDVKVVLKRDKRLTYLQKVNPMFRWRLVPIFKRFLNDNLLPTIIEKHLSNI